MRSQMNEPAYQDIFGGILKYYMSKLYQIIQGYDPAKLNSLKNKTNFSLQLTGIIIINKLYL